MVQSTIVDCFVVAFFSFFGNFPFSISLINDIKIYNLFILKMFICVTNKMIIFELINVRHKTISLVPFQIIRHIFKNVVIGVIFRYLPILLLNQTRVVMLNCVHSVVPDQHLKNNLSDSIAYVKLYLLIT